VDSYSLGRHTSEGTEPMTGVDSGDLQRRIAQGTEHLSSLREAYLKELAGEAKLDYARLTAPHALSTLLLRRRYAHPQEVVTDLGLPLALAALACSIAATCMPLLRRPRAGDRPVASFLRGSSHLRPRRHESL
jgi:hypothetical protein